MEIKLVAWDYDGVLNRDETDFDRVSRDFERALGLSFKRFVTFHFTENRFRPVITGAQAIEEVFSAWLAQEGAQLRVSELIAWWLEANHRPDRDMSRLANRVPQRQVIATNNETRRAGHIRDVAGWAARVDMVFASGEMQAAKPDPDFFSQIEDWAAVAPGEILLIDDSAANIDAAKARGWQVFHFTDDTRDALPSLLGL